MQNIAVIIPARQGSQAIKDKNIKKLKNFPLIAYSIAAAKLAGITKNSVLAIRNKSYWNYNNLNAKDPVAIGIVSQKELQEAIEKAERRIKREKKEREKLQKSQQLSN